MNELYYLGKAEYLKHSENFQLPYIIEKNINNLADNQSHVVEQSTIAHKTFMESYLLVSGEHVCILLNPLMTDSYYFFNVDSEAGLKILKQQSEEDSIGELSKFLVNFHQLNTLTKLSN